MILTVARKEFREMMREGRFSWASAILAILLSVSLVTGWRHYAVMKAQRDTVQKVERERWLNKGDMDPHGAAHYGFYVFKPQMPLSMIDRGIDAYTGVSAMLEAHQQKLFQYKPAQDGIPLQRVGELTAAATLQILLPLLIVLLLSPVFVREREQGALRQVLSLGVRKNHLAWGKVLGTVIPLFLMIIPITAFGVVVLALNSNSQGLLQSGGRLLTMILCYLAYFAIFSGLVISVSALASTTRQALTVMLSFWFINALALPSAAMDMAGYVCPTPNGFQFSAAIMEEQKGRATLEERVIQMRERLLKEYNVASEDDLPVSRRGIQLLEEEDLDTKIYAKHFDALYDRYEQQNRVYRTGALAAPIIALQSLSMGLAGTDFAHFRHFAQYAEQYRRQMVRILNEDIAFNDLPGNRKTSLWISNDHDYSAGRELWEKVPPFAYSSPGLGWVLRQHRFSLVVLLVWFAAIAAAAPLAVRKLKVD
jgi:ABC-2 type transport system permease protein